MKIKTFLIIGFATLAMLSCHRGPKPPVSQQNLPISMSKPAKGDKLSTDLPAWDAQTP